MNLDNFCSQSNSISWAILAAVSFYIALKMDERKNE